MHLSQKRYCLTAITALAATFSFANAQDQAASSCCSSNPEPPADCCAPSTAQASGTAAAQDAASCSSAPQSCQATSTAASGDPVDLPTLDSSLDGLAKAFNDAADQPRIVALLSPTCGGCVYGAKALLEKALQANPDEDVRLFVVWEPMIGGDSEEAARQSAAMFDDPRVVQFWDPGKHSGISYARDVFPDGWRQLLAAMDHDAPLRDVVQRGAESDPSQRPVWDFAAFYPAGARWDDVPPTPESFIRQLAIFEQPNGDTEATLVTDSFAKGTIESDWYDEVGSRTASIIGAFASAVVSPGTVSECGVNCECCPGSPNYKGQ